MKKVLVSILGVVALLGLTGCSTSTQPDQVGLAYNDGPFSPRTFDKCIPVSKREVQGPNDVAFVYPANQRTDDFTGGDGADRGPFPIVSKDGVQMAFPGNLQFLLNTECDTLRAFHERIGNRYEAYFDGNESKGWSKKVLPLYIEQPLQSALSAAASRHNWRDLYNDPAVRVEVQNAVEESLPTFVNDQTEGTEEFFKNFVLTLQVPQPPDELKAAITQEQTAVAQANSAKAQATAQVQQAIAETQVAEQRAKQKAAEIAGFPNIEAYLRFLLIEKGGNPFQPTVIGPVAPK